MSYVSHVNFARFSEKRKNGLKLSFFMILLKYSDDDNTMTLYNTRCRFRLHSHFNRIAQGNTVSYIVILVRRVRTCLKKETKNNQKHQLPLITFSHLYYISGLKKYSHIINLNIVLSEDDLETNESHT